MDAIGHSKIRVCFFDLIWTKYLTKTTHKNPTLTFHLWNLTYFWTVLDRWQLIVCVYSFILGMLQMQCLWTVQESHWDTFGFKERMVCMCASEKALCLLSIQHVIEMRCAWACICQCVTVCCHSERIGGMIVIYQGDGSSDGIINANTCSATR